ncbi:hypothetical protein [Sapientia aquatica]|uniref:Uncharacterized protein n=1 Tax=Sapientia aquatica TaxID=1549640 RepID=A0A4R5W6M5_9BURK|nr:hypothetical protein [Sapientia aquatica]TDK68054.1 hypothetical protein E2I14_00400 [Sapientia aquatica]
MLKKLWGVTEAIFGLTVAVLALTLSVYLFKFANLYLKATTSELTAYATTLIGLSALITTLWQVLITREHNRNSIRPCIEYYCNRDQHSPVALSIMNNGHGAAIIESMEFKYSGVSYPFTSKSVRDLIDEDSAIFGTKISATVIHKGTAFPVGQKIDLLIFSNSIDSPSNHNAAVNILNNIQLTIRYKSLYNENFSSNLT